MAKNAVISEKEALMQLQKMCSAKEYCEFDIIQKLKRWKVSKQTNIIKLLVDEDFVNEKRYANAFVNDKWRFSKWGKYKILYALRGKGISDENIQSALLEIDSVRYKEMVISELLKKSKSLEKDEVLTRKHKLYRFAQQRGYEQEIVIEHLNTISE